MKNIGRAFLGLIAGGVVGYVVSLPFAFGEVWANEFPTTSLIFGIIFGLIGAGIGLSWGNKTPQ